MVVTMRCGALRGVAAKCRRISRTLRNLDLSVLTRPAINIGRLYDTLDQPNALQLPASAGWWTVAETLAASGTLQGISASGDCGLDNGHRCLAETFSRPHDSSVGQEGGLCWQ